MADMLVCAECEQDFPESMITRDSFVFPALSNKGLEGITVNYNICTRCFVNGGLSERQKERITNKILKEMEE